MNDDEHAGVRGQIRRSPFLQAYGGAFPDLTAAGAADLGQTFERLGEMAGATKVTAPATVTFTLRQGDATRSWTLRLSDGACDVRAERAEAPDLEVLTDEQTWLELARGEVLPLEAFGRGSVRVLGDIGLAQRFLHAVSKGR